MCAPGHPCSAESKFRLLYLGNDLKFIAALRQVLTAPVYLLVAGSDGGGAELFLKSNIQYDLLIIDFDWRGKEGLELARVAHSLRHRREMPIMMVAATRITREVKTLAQKAGVKEFVVKTRDAGAESETIRQLVERTPREN